MFVRNISLLTTARQKCQSHIYNWTKYRTWSILQSVSSKYCKLNGYSHTWEIQTMNKSFDFFSNPRWSFHKWLKTTWLWMTRIFFRFMSPYNHLEKRFGWRASLELYKCFIETVKRLKKFLSPLATELRQGYVNLTINIMYWWDID